MKQMAKNFIHDGEAQEGTYACTDKIDFHVLIVGDAFVSIQRKPKDELKTFVNGVGEKCRILTCQLALQQKNTKACQEDVRGDPQIVVPEAVITHVSS
jgi:hypothetical protein